MGCCHLHIGPQYDKNETDAATPLQTNFDLQYKESMKLKRISVELIQKPSHDFALCTHGV